MADETTNTPSKRARNSATETVASGKGASLVSASSRGLIVTIQPPHQFLPDSPALLTQLFSNRSLVAPRLARRESEVAHAKALRSRLLSPPMNLSVVEDVLGRFSPKRILLRQLQLQLRRL